MDNDYNDNDDDNDDDDDDEDNEKDDNNSLALQTIWRIRRDGFKRVALQMPEGLTLFATTISDIIEKVSFSVKDILGSFYANILPIFLTLDKLKQFH